MPDVTLLNIGRTLSVPDGETTGPEYPNARGAEPLVGLRECGGLLPPFEHDPVT